MSTHIDAITPDGVLQYWFGTDTDPAVIAANKNTLWWGKSSAIDSELRDRFGSMRERAVQGELEEWQETSRGRLALIILVDQVSRNIFRDLPAAFSYDYYAQELCLTGIDIGADEELRPIERVFFYLPMEHSESRVDQVRSVTLFTTLAAQVPAGEQKMFAGFVDFARKHQTIIERFGRFPHRNKILNRPSTEAELKFLQEPDSAF